MSWLAKLYETYEAGFLLDSQEDGKLMPIGHTLQNAHINIVIDEHGNFKRAQVLEKTKIVLPATEGSAGRSSGEAPHPLADKIQYVAKDYSAYGGKKKSYFGSYEKQLAGWCDSIHSHQKANAVYKYISKGHVVKDLVTAGVLFLDDNKSLLAYWPYEGKNAPPVPLIFKVLPALPKGKRTHPDKVEVEPGDALVCWTVESFGVLDSTTWSDISLHQSWIEYDARNFDKIGICSISGKERPLSVNHPAKLRHTGDKAKLLSANDLTGFTFRGRFTDSLQAAGVSFEVTQKAHNALRWLISRQGYKNGEQVFVTWAVSGKTIPSPMEDSWTIMKGLPDLFLFEIDEEDAHESMLDHSQDLGESFAQQFKKYLAGYSRQIKPNDQIVIMGLDSATPGRMGIIYYRELLGSEFFNRLESWHTQFAWFQRHVIEISDNRSSKKPTKKIVWPVGAPVPRNIADAAYGDILKTNATLRKNLLERIMPCIADGRPFPWDILHLAVKRTSNRNSCEPWEWERNLGITCALYKGFYRRHSIPAKRRKYSMNLDENYKSRDYLFGRLLAVAEQIEEVALRLGGENRSTNAARLMQRFADRPFSTWRTIELSLQPYMQRLQSARGGFLANRKKELDLIESSFENTEFTLDKPLTGEFLLGYHCQRMCYRNVATDRLDETKNQVEGSK
nr:type I-C CRISPR-associated protein Cas8c/Csd1 [uncultured Desulfobulbus sp.]